MWLCKKAFRNDEQDTIKARQAQKGREQPDGAVYVHRPKPFLSTAIVTVPRGEDQSSITRRGPKDPKGSAAPPSCFRYVSDGLDRRKRPSQPHVYSSLSHESQFPCSRAVERTSRSMLPKD